MAINIDFLSNVGAFLRGTDDVEGALDDVAGSLDDLVGDARSSARRAGDELGEGLGHGATDAARAVDDVEAKLAGLEQTAGGQAAGDELAGGLRAGGSDAETAVVGLEGKLKALQDAGAGADTGGELGSGVRAGASDAKRELDGVQGSFRDLATASKRDTDKLATNLGSSVRDGADNVSDGVGEMKDTVDGGLKEIGGSFDGTWQSAAGGVQGVVAEVGAGFGPAGLIAGVVAAGGLGLIISQIEGGEEKSEEFKGKVGELASELIQAGRSGGRGIGEIQSAIEDLAVSQDDTNLAAIYNNAKAAGLDYRDVVAALVSGNAREIGKERAKIGELGQEYYETAAQAEDLGDGTYSGALVSLDALGLVDTALKDQQKIARDAARAQEAAAKAGLTEYGLKRAAIEQLQGAYDDAAGEVDDYINEESGLLNIGDYIKAFHKREEALRDYAETLAKSALSPEAKAFIEDQGQEQAATLLAGYKRATPGQRDELNRIWSTSGRTSASSYAEALGDDLRDATVKGPRVLAPDTAAYRRAVREAHAESQAYLRDHPLQAGYVAYTSYGKPIPG